jgi:spoIIIJ-associated protein
MNEPKRRFFSGDSLQQALVQAANHFKLDPEEIAYRSIEKKHGFLKVRRKVVIEVNPDAPKKDRSAPPPPPPSVAAAEPPPPALRAADPAAEPARPAPAERRPPRERSEHGDRRRGDGRQRDAPRPHGDRSPRGERGGSREDRPRGEGRRSAPPRSAPRTAPRLSSTPSAPPLILDEMGDPPQPRGPVMGGNGLFTLPDAPRRPSERYPEASGPMAEAAAKGAELLLRIAGLELTPRVLQGEDRLEVDLAGEDVDWCFADDGELVMAIEHLLPRLIRTMSGETTLVRVDCDNFQEIREERLRSLAQRVAEEVRRRGKPRTLEPMNPADRRIVHITLADDPGVVTESEGDGYFKRITVRPA